MGDHGQEVGRAAAALHARVLQSLESGQAEYAGTEGPFGNFDRVASLMGCEREVVLMVYLQKHIDGLWAYARGHRSQRESVRGRIGDAAAYLALLEAMVASREGP